MSDWQEQRTLFLFKEERIVVLWIIAATLNAYAGDHQIKKPLGGCGESSKKKMEEKALIVRELDPYCEIFGPRIQWNQVPNPSEYAE